LRANAVARETTTDECTDGIHPLPRDLSKFQSPDESLIVTPLIITDSTKATAGTKISVS